MKKVKVLISGCACNRKFGELVENVVKENGLNAEISIIEDIMEMMQYNVMTFPAIVVDEKVVAKGKLSYEQVKELLSK